MRTSTVRSLPPVVIVALASALVAATGIAGCGDDEEQAGPAPYIPPAGGSGGAGATTTTTGSGLQGAGGTGGGGTAGSGGSGGCVRALAAADRTRYVVVAKPNDVGTGGSTGDLYGYEVLELSETGVLSRPGTTFEMGRASSGHIAFTPDGEIGIVAQPDDPPFSSSLGVFRIDAAGAVTVIEDHHQGDYYGESVVMAPSGDRAYVLDGNWRENGGGVYVVHIGCDGTITDGGMLFASKLPAALTFLPGAPNRALLAADDAFSSASELDVHLLSWSATPSWLAGTDAFPDDDAIVSSLAVMPNGMHALVGDISEFSGVPTRIGVVRIDGDDVSGVQVLTPVEDPYDIVASPHGNAALVVSGYDNAVILLSYDSGNASAPFAVVGEPAYQGNSPELPGSAVMVERGGLTGLVLVSELSGVRPFLFQTNGTVQDQGRFYLGDGVENMAGAIGVQP